MRYTFLLLIIGFSHFGSAQNAIDLNMLSGSYDSLGMYVIGDLDKGPMNFFEDATYVFEYDSETKSGFLTGINKEKKAIEIIYSDSIYNIDITFEDGYIKKGIIEQCDSEKLRIRFESVIEEYMKKE